jgi:radical SAM protein with 4Fe4S-binding SPASM domain
MANLIVTNACNLDCPFCFASEYLANEPGCRAERMSVEEMERVLGFTEGDARLCGGEPSTHPHFVEMLEVGLARKDRAVFVMTNGVWPEAARAFIAALPYKEQARVTCLVNALEPALLTDAQRRERDATLRTLHPRTLTLGFTLYAPDQDLDYIFDLAERHGVERLRMSVASPNLTDPRSWHVDPRRDYRPLAGAVHSLFLRAKDSELQLHSDCGYLPPCVFDDEQLADLRPLLDAERLKFSCEGPIDIGPGGEAWRCYGLYSSVRGNVADYDDLADMAESFERQTQQLGREHDLFDECPTCDHRADGTCAGGCYALRALGGAERRAVAAGVTLDGAGFASAVPRLDEARVHASAGSDRWRLKDREGAWGELALGPGEAEVLRACDGRRSVREIVAVVEAAALRRYTGARVERTLRRLFESGAIELRAPQRGRLPIVA